MDRSNNARPTVLLLIPLQITQLPILLHPMLLYTTKLFLGDEIR